MRHFLDQACLDTAIAQQLQFSPAILSAHVPALQRILRRDLLLLPLGHRVQPSADDPEWAKQRAARYEPVQRLGSEGAIQVRELVSALLFTLERLALAAERKDHPLYVEIVKKLRGITHWKLDLDCLEPLEEPLDLARLYGLQSLHDGVRYVNAYTLAEFGPPVPSVRVGRLVGTLLRTRDEILALGREANNCLGSDWRLRRVFCDGEQIWALRNGDDLIAVVSADASGRVAEISGPRNCRRFGAWIHEVAAFIGASGLCVNTYTSVLLADLVPSASVIDDHDAPFGDDILQILPAA